MLRKINRYVGLFAAILNIVSSMLLYYSATHRMTRPDESGVEESLGFWFAAVAVILWAVFLVLAVVAKKR